MKKVAASILLLGALLITDPLASDHHLNTTEDLRHESVTLPASTPDRSRLAVVQTLTFFEEELGAGVLVVHVTPTNMHGYKDITGRYPQPARPQEPSR